jgi:hypothetical protein
MGKIIKLTLSLMCPLSTRAHCFKEPRYDAPYPTINRAMNSHGRKTCEGARSWPVLSVCVWWSLCVCLCVWGVGGWLVCVAQTYEFDNGDKIVFYLHFRFNSKLRPRQ